MGSRGWFSRIEAGGLVSSTLPLLVAQPDNELRTASQPAFVLFAENCLPSAQNVHRRLKNNDGERMPGAFLW
jgi:hypothetical protein